MVLLLLRHAIATVYVVLVALISAPAILGGVVVFVDAASSYDTIDGHPCFRNLEGITESMFDLVDLYPNLASISIIGMSYLKSINSNGDDEYDLPQNGYDIYAMNITSSSSSSSSDDDDDDPQNHHLSSDDKGKTMIITGVHPREYAPPELAMRFAETLLRGYDTDPDITWLLRHTEIHMIFHVNPDARYITEVYPKTSWRKNVNPEQSRGRCSSDEIGVDINRNYDFMWGDPNGSSSDPCDSTYHGRSPISEPETRAVVDYARNLFPEGQRKDDPEGDLDVPYGEDITGVFMDIHSPGGYVYYPWGFEDAMSPDDDALQALGRKLSSFNGYVLWAGGQPDFLYAASGDSSDYMYAVLGVASFGLELGEDFYEDCDLFEDTVVPDNLPALLYAASTSKKPFSLGKGPDILDLEVTPDIIQDGTFRVTVVASDSEMVNSIKGYPDFATGDQGVDAVRLYLDVHPDDYEASGTAQPAWDMQLAGANSGEQRFELEASLAAGVSSGRHTLYAQAMDGDGYVGPVSSVFVNVEKMETAVPSKKPTSPPTEQPTYSPSRAPSAEPTTAEPSPSPTGRPSKEPSGAPTTAEPSPSPTGRPSKEPSGAPITAKPSPSPTGQPSKAPSGAPITAEPSPSPTGRPTISPSKAPSLSPATAEPSVSPTGSPTTSPFKPTVSPSQSPSASPTKGPTAMPTTSNPSTSPTTNPTSSSEPSFPPTSAPSNNPSTKPTTLPTTSPSKSPTPNTTITTLPTQSESTAGAAGTAPSPSSGNQSTTASLFVGLALVSGLLMM